MPTGVDGRSSDRAARRLPALVAAGTLLAVLALGALWIDPAGADVPGDVPSNAPASNTPGAFGKRAGGSPALPEPPAVPAERAAAARFPAPTLAASLDPEAEDPPPPAIEPRTERQFRDAFLALAASEGAAALASAADRTLSGDGPDQEKAAVLMALFESDTPGAAGFAARAIAELPDVSRPEAVSLPELAAGQLQRHAARDAESRAVLLALVDGRVPTANASLRRSAAACLARVGSSDDLIRLSSALQPEQDRSLLAGVASALRDNPHAEAVAHVFRGLLPDVARAAVDGAEPQ